MPDNNIKRLKDHNTPLEERLDNLIESLTIEEKLTMFTWRMPPVERLGLEESFLGGEAAHGIQQRNDQEGEVYPPVTSTVFPQPIGMSMSWDKELLRAAGEVAGTEARIISVRQNNGGLSRWAPTVDLERDPRWGRNEEGYGEDPVLTGELAGAYVLGMQGDDPGHNLRIACVLKHFYANNTEDGRVYKDSSVDDRNKYEYYLEVFRRVIKRGHAEGIMASYNKINGVPGMVNEEIRDILKEKYGVVHAVSDGGAPTLLRTEHHYCEDDAAGIAASIKAGVDMMLEKQEMVDNAVRTAYERGTLTEEDINRALRSSMKTRFRLGILDDECVNPYAKTGDEEPGSEYAQAVCRELSREAIVLLKNDGVLPISEDTDPSDVLVAGPVSDRWDMDWYCGIPFERSTLKNGVDEVMGTSVDCAECCDRVKLSYEGENGGINIGEYILEDWGENCFCFREALTGMYLAAPYDDGEVKADHASSFEWFPMTVFGIEHLNKEEISLTDWKKRRVKVSAEGKLWVRTDKGTDDKPQDREGNEGELMRVRNLKADGMIPEEARLKYEQVSSSPDELRAAAEGKKYIILALGNHPLIKGREGIDRTTLALPGTQEALWRAAMELPSVQSGECKVILAVISNYPYALSEADRAVNAVIFSATGSQYMGRAVADALFGRTCPAGRLSQTWPVSEKDLPPIDDYDIIGGGRTYRFMRAKPLYPFGYGLTYTTFKYLRLSAVYNSSEDIIHIHTAICNTGNVCSDEVVEIYGIAPDSDVQKPKCQLVDFGRVRGIRPGELRDVSFTAVPDVFAIYDASRGKKVVEAGEYVIYAGRSCEDECMRVTLTLPELVYDI